MKTVKSTMTLKRRVQSKTTIVEYADASHAKYTVVVKYESELVEKPRFFDFKRYYGYMIIILGQMVNIVVTESKWWALAYMLVAGLGMFFWIMTYIGKIDEYEGEQL